MLIRLILCISQVVIERVDRGRFTKASTRSARDDRLDESSNFVQEGRRGGVPFEAFVREFAIFRFCSF